LIRSVRAGSFSVATSINGLPAIADVTSAGDMPRTIPATFGVSLSHAVPGNAGWPPTRLATECGSTALKSASSRVGWAELGAGILNADVIASPAMILLRAKTLFQTMTHPSKAQAAISARQPAASPENLFEDAGQ